MPLYMKRFTARRPEEPMFTFIILFDVIQLKSCDVILYFAVMADATKGEK